VLPVLISLVMLSKPETPCQKAALLVSVICQHTIDAVSVSESEIKYQVLSKQQLNLVLVSVCSVAMIVLPVFACDYPSLDRRGMLKILVQWP
jgi:hypothetical protein